MDGWRSDIQICLAGYGVQTIERIWITSFVSQVKLYWKLFQNDKFRMVEAFFVFLTRTIKNTFDIYIISVFVSYNLIFSEEKGWILAYQNIWQLGGAEYAWWRNWNLYNPLTYALWVTDMGNISFSTQIHLSFWAKRSRITIRFFSEIQV